jgi:hypothetical protein
LGDFLATLLRGSRVGEVVRESLTIGGWVSMWRPLEVFLYDWWPIRNEARLSDRLAVMPIRIMYAGDDNVHYQRSELLINRLVELQYSL